MNRETSTVPDERRSLYGRLWRAVPRDVGYLALTGVLVFLAGSAYGIAGSILSSFGDGLTTVVVFAILVLAGLYFAKFFGAFELQRLGWARQPPVRPVVWRERTATNRFVRFLEVAADPHYWLYLIYTVVVFPVLGGFLVGLIGSIIVAGFAGLIGGITLLVLQTRLGGLLWSSLDANLWFVDNLWVAGVVAVIMGLALLALIPFLTRGGVLVMNAVATPLLGGFLSEQLEAEVAGLQVSRSAAVSAEGTALRRLERDIHDGPQQRLIRMQMDLAAASRAAGHDPERSKALIEEALQHSRDALEELRALSRGFAPPLLLDRGLAPALEAVVDRATVPTRFTNELPDGVVIPVEIERNAYFIAAELLTNVGKHAVATRAELFLSAPAVGADRELQVIVTDDGRGGAAVRAGHGLAGIQERLTGLGGRIELRSPVGGPTHARVRIPVAATVEEEPPAESVPSQAAPASDAAWPPPADAPVPSAADPAAVPAADAAPDAAADPAASPASDDVTTSQPTLPYPTEELPRDAGSGAADGAPGRASTKSARGPVRRPKP
jgi:hypothetical protein